MFLSVIVLRELYQSEIGEKCNSRKFYVFELKGLTKQTSQLCSMSMLLLVSTLQHRDNCLQT